MQLIAHKVYTFTSSFLRIWQSHAEMIRIYQEINYNLICDSFINDRARALSPKWTLSTTAIRNPFLHSNVSIIYYENIVSSHDCERVLAFTRRAHEEHSILLNNDGMASVWDVNKFRTVNFYSSVERVCMVYLANCHRIISEKRIFGSHTSLAADLLRPHRADIFVYALALGSLHKSGANAFHTH